MTTPLLFPDIDPVAFSLLGLPVRWYALAYLGGFVLGWRYCMALVRTRSLPPLSKHYDDFLTWAVIGVVLGGRLGYVLFYNLPRYLEHPLEIFVTWHGGMSFHGGLVGVVLAAYLFARRQKIPFWQFMDTVAAVAPIGLFLGRLANFVNGELYGRVTDSPLGMIFPHSDGLPRHPSQLYQAGMEGVLLFVVLLAVTRSAAWQERHGLLSGVFLTGYGIARIIGECFRQPDAQLGFIFESITMGQILSLPMVLFGAWLINRSRQAKASL